MERHNLCSSSFTNCVAKSMLMSRGEGNVTYMADIRMHIEDWSEDLQGRGYFGDLPLF
jgi:hypothetical protein